MGQKCLNGDQGNPAKRRDSEERKWGKETHSHLQRSPAGSSVGGRGKESRLELYRGWQRELKQGLSNPRIWGGADYLRWSWCNNDRNKCLSLSHVQLFVTLCTVAHQAPQSIEFFRQEYCSGLSSPSPGDLPDPGIEPRSPALQADSL